MPARDSFAFDPFVAVGDLTAMISSFAFYRYLVVVHPDPQVMDEFQAFRMAEFAWSIDPGECDLLDSSESATGHPLRDEWASAYAMSVAGCSRRRERLASTRSRRPDRIDHRSGQLYRDQRYGGPWS